MPRYREDGLMSQLVATFGAAAGGYLLESWQKASPGSPLPLATGGATLVGTALGRRITRHPILSETMEALQYGSSWGLGRWAADITTTIGNHAPGAAVPWMPGTSAGAPTALVDPVNLVTPLPSHQPVTGTYRYNRRRTAY